MIPWLSIDEFCAQNPISRSSIMRALKGLDMRMDSTRTIKVKNREQVLTLDIWKVRDARNFRYLVVEVDRASLV